MSTQSAAKGLAAGAQTGVSASGLATSVESATNSGASGSGLRDPVTALPNQPALQRRLQAAPISGSLALLQLANFYEIRSQIGDSQSDQLLREVVAALLAALPPAAVLYRCDNFEFAVLLADSWQCDVVRLGDDIEKALEQAMPAPGLRFSCVVGLTRLDANRPDIGRLLARARHTLGRGHFARALNRGQPALSRKPLSATGLCQALKQDCLQYHYQPILYWQDEDLQHFEMRTRLVMEGQTYGGDELFEVAVPNALGEYLDRLALAEALEILQASGDPTLRLTVNLSLNSLVSENFHAWLERRLVGHETLRDSLHLQLGETDLLVAQHHMALFSYRLKRLGVKLCIRHFGCFEDSLGYLSLLRCHSVRLDAGLAQGLLDDDKQFVRLERIVLALKEKQIDALAGTLEDIRLLPLLWRAGVAAVQGDCLAPVQSCPTRVFPRATALG